MQRRVSRYDLLLLELVLQNPYSVVLPTYHIRYLFINCKLMLKRTEFWRRNGLRNINIKSGLAMWTKVYLVGDPNVHTHLYTG